MTLLTVNQVAVMLSVSRSQVFKLRKLDNFPEPTCRPERPGTPLWKLQDINRYKKKV
jgi:hypothetical protein